MFPILSLIIGVIGLGFIAWGLNFLGLKKYSGYVILIVAAVIGIYFLSKSGFSLVYTILGEFLNMAIENLLVTALICIIALIIVFVRFYNKK